jgi:hypothetical protein
LEEFFYHCSAPLFLARKGTGGEASFAINIFLTFSEVFQPKNLQSRIYIDRS